MLQPLAVCHACVSICFAYIVNSSGNDVSHIVLLDSLLAEMQNQRLAKLWSSSGGVNRIYSVYVTKIIVLAWTYKLTRRFMVFISCEIDKTYNRYLPDVFNARNACGMATCGAGRSKNTASAFPFSDSSNPSSQTSR